MPADRLLPALRWEADCLTTIRHEMGLHADQPWMSAVSFGIVGFEGFPPDTRVGLDVTVAKVQHRVSFDLREFSGPPPMDPTGAGSILFTNIEEMIRSDDWP